MRIGLAQMNIIWENKEQNMVKVRDCLDRFVEVRSSADNSASIECADTESGNDILFFPEMSLTGFSMNTAYTSESAKETVRECEELAREYGVSIGIGWVKHGEPLCENHYSIITPDSGEILDYAKIHPFSYGGESEYFIGGDSLCTCSVGDMKIGTAICYDLRFPEIFQILSDSVDLIVVPANWPERRKKHWMTLLEARAIENQCYIAGVNCCGMMNDMYYSGDSCLYGPDGIEAETVYKIVLGEHYNEEKIFVYDVQNKVSEVRAAFPVKNDRRKDLYRIL